MKRTIKWLLEGANTSDKSVVVRWCVAFALTEIAKNNPKVGQELRSRIEEITRNETNNGVKNVYLKP